MYIYIYTYMNMFYFNSIKRTLRDVPTLPEWIHGSFLHFHAYP